MNEYGGVLRRHLLSVRFLPGYTLDAMGRPVGLTGTGLGTVWVQNVAYGPGGEMKTMQYAAGSGFWYTENRSFNSRTQATQIQVAHSGGKVGMNVQYGYTAGANNGQIATSTDLPSGEQVVYTYDSNTIGVLWQDTTSQPSQGLITAIVLSTRCCMA